MKDEWLIALIPVDILAVIVIWHVHKCIKDYPKTIDQIPNEEMK